MLKLLILVFVAASVAAVPTTNEVELNCNNYSSDERISCMIVKTCRALDEAAKEKEISIIDGVTFSRKTPIDSTVTRKMEKSGADIMTKLPQDYVDRTFVLSKMLSDSLYSFLKGHTLKFNLTENSMPRAFVEGRAKLKKMALPLIAAVGLKAFALGPILIGGLAFLALKAFVYSKIAFIIAAIIALHKMFTGGNAGFSNLFNKSSPPIGSWYDNNVAPGWSAGSVGSQPQGYYRRNFEEGNANAQNLAYSAHAPATGNDTD